MKYTPGKKSSKKVLGFSYLFAAFAAFFVPLTNAWAVDDDDKQPPLPSSAIYGAFSGGFFPGQPSTNANTEIGRRLEATMSLPNIYGSYSTGLPTSLLPVDTPAGAAFTTVFNSVTDLPPPSSTTSPSHIPSSQAVTPPSTLTPFSYGVSSEALGTVQLSSTPPSAPAFTGRSPVGDGTASVELRETKKTLKPTVTRRPPPPPVLQPWESGANPELADVLRKGRKLHDSDSENSDEEEWEEDSPSMSSSPQSTANKDNTHSTDDDLPFPYEEDNGGNRQIPYVTSSELDRQPSSFPSSASHESTQNPYLSGGHETSWFSSLTGYLPSWLGGGSSATSSSSNDRPTPNTDTPLQDASSSSSSGNEAPILSSPWSWLWPFGNSNTESTSSINDTSTTTSSTSHSTTNNDSVVEPEPLTLDDALNEARDLQINSSSIRLSTEALFSSFETALRNWDLSTTDTTASLYSQTSMTWSIQMYQLMTQASQTLNRATISEAYRIIDTQFSILERMNPNDPTLRGMRRSFHQLYPNSGANLPAEDNLHSMSSDDVMQAIAMLSNEGVYHLITHISPKNLPAFLGHLSVDCLNELRIHLSEKGKTASQPLTSSSASSSSSLEDSQSSEGETVSNLSQLLAAAVQAKRN